MGRQLEIGAEHWPIAGAFAISRGTRTEAVVVTATIREDGVCGRGECVPYARYGETVDGVVAAVRTMEDPVRNGITPDLLRRHLPAGAARNVLDCALLDLEAKKRGSGIAEVLGLDPLRPVVTAYTLSLAAPDRMAEAARSAADRPILKLKLGGDGDADRLAAVRRAAPRARLIVDCNESWTAANFEANMAACVAACVELIEQPLPVGDDALLAGMARPIPICADESVHMAADLDDLADRYDAVNIKLDKAGGLTEALDLLRAAEARRLRIMVGCMVGTSLAMAPALVLAQRADFVDLDGPLLLARDRKPGLRYRGSHVDPPPPELWG
jgi:L-alanine-DL-glutamate epimerase-like enolase superfamily enzyme